VTDLLTSPLEGVTLKTIQANGITLRYAEAGSGPLVLFCHGWPESWYSWRHLLKAVSAAGFRAVAPDMRGFGGSDAPQEIERYGGQPNKQPADLLTAVEPGRMIWHGYTGAAGWMLRDAFEGVVGASLANNELVLPQDLQQPRGPLTVTSVRRDLSQSPLNGPVR